MEDIFKPFCCLKKEKNGEFSVLINENVTELKLFRWTDHLLRGAIKFIQELNSKIVETYPIWATEWILPDLIWGCISFCPGV